MMIKTSTVSAIGAAMTVAVMMAGTAQAQIIASDNFNRADGGSLGTTPVGNLEWIENEVSDQMGILDDRAYMNTRVTGGSVSAILDVDLLNVDITMTLQAGTNWPISDNYYGGIMYRVAETDTVFGQAGEPNGAAGYSVAMNLQPGTVSLMWGNTVLTMYGPAGVFSTDPYVLRVTAIGNQHTVYLNGSQILSYTDLDPTHLASGAVGMGTYYGNYNISEYTVAAAVPEPASLALMGLVGLGLAGYRWRNRRAKARA